MKYSFLIIYIFLFTPVYSQNAQAILTKVQDKLNSLKTLQYDQALELDYPKDDYHSVRKWTCYYDFSRQKPVGFKHQVEENTGNKWVYNGTELFALNKSTKKYKKKDNPPKQYFEALPFFYNSLITLKNALPLIMKDKSISKTVVDTLVNNQTYQLLTLGMGKRRLKSLGDGFKVFKTKRNFSLQILINPAHDLPVEILQKNDLDKSTMTTSFKNYNFNPTSPNPNSWNLASYKTYQPAQKKVKQVAKQLAPGSIAPDWKLNKLKGNKTLALSDLKGKVVLIKFWEKTCGYCMASIPYLKKLKNKYQNKDFELVGINAYDSKEVVEKLFKLKKFNYPILLNGKSISKKYGITSYPRFIIVDKSGKVVSYHVGFNKTIFSEIEKTIQKTL